MRKGRRRGAGKPQSATGLQVLPLNKEMRCKSSH